jgi:methyl-accepting chemotaxis protein
MSGEHDLDQRLRFLKIDEHGRAALRSLKPFLDEELPGALGAFYDQLRLSPDARAQVRDPALIEQARIAQSRHWDGVSKGEYDDRYVASIGATARAHAKAGMEPRWYIDGCALVAEQLVRAMVRRTWPKAGLFRNKKAPSADQVADSLAALIKAMMLDMDFVVSAYRGAEARTHAKREQALIEEQQSVLGDSIGFGLERLAEGDLEFRLTDELPEDYEKLRADFNDTVGHLQETVGAVSRNTQAIRAGAAEISSPPTTCRAAPSSRPPAWRRPPRRSTRSPPPSQDRRRRKQAATSSPPPPRPTPKSGEVVRERGRGDGRDRTSSKQISQIIGVIDEIAFQTNLLA